MPALMMARVIVPTYISTPTHCTCPGSKRRMAKYGVLMLEKLVLQYCPKDGSSSGMRCAKRPGVNQLGADLQCMPRVFLSELLPAIKAKYTQLEIQAVIKHSRHPKAIGFYSESWWRWHAYDTGFRVPHAPFDTVARHIRACECHGSLNEH